VITGKPNLHISLGIVAATTTAMVRRDLRCAKYVLQSASISFELIASCLLFATKNTYLTCGMNNAEQNCGEAKLRFFFICFEWTIMPNISDISNKTNFAYSQKALDGLEVTLPNNRSKNTRASNVSPTYSYDGSFKNDQLNAVGTTTAPSGIAVEQLALPSGVNLSAELSGDSRATLEGSVELSKDGSAAKISREAGDLVAGVEVPIVQSDQFSATAGLNTKSTGSINLEGKNWSADASTDGNVYDVSGEIQVDDSVALNAGVSGTFGEAPEFAAGVTVDGVDIQASQSSDLSKATIEYQTTF
jgi:hypothetical protein